MTSLREALQVTAWRRLRAIGRRRRLRLSSSSLKADLVERLAPALLDPTSLNAALSQLSESERRLLDDLLMGGGRLPLRYLRARHGGLPPLTAGGGGAGPLEGLRALGLIFHDRTTGDVFIPTDIIPLLPPLAQSAPPTVAPAQGADEPAFIAAHDLACLLALLQAGDVQPLHGRWLPPNFLAAWGERCAMPPATPNARSEMQTGRRRFLHYLAEAAGLIGLAGPYLTPTPAAWAWLNAAPADRLNALWQTFLASDSALWRIYRLPGHDLTPHPDKLIAAVIQALPGHDPADPVAFAAALLARQPALRDLLPANQLDADADLIAAIVELLKGPLVWMGALRQIEMRDREGLYLSPLSLSITAWGAHWLGMAPVPEIPPPWPVGQDGPPRFALTSDIPGGVLTLTLTGGLPDPAHLMCLEACAVRRSRLQRDIPGNSLVGFCYRAQAERVFRVDRIRSIVKAPMEG